MIIKAFSYGKGGGHGPVNYVVSAKYKEREGLPPVVLRGDPAMTTKLIDNAGAQGRVWKFSAGVLSWHPDDKVTPKQEQKIMDAFEQLAFAGLPADAYNILWVRHNHTSHHELHFVIPRMELSTGKAFNPLPPGWQKEFDVLRNLFNEREGWARPDDPARARTRQPGNTGLVNARRKRHGLPEKEDPREAVHAYVEERIAQGLIRDRADVLQSLREVGLEINRSGQNYITFILPENGRKYRLKGGVYDASWNIERTAAIQDRARQEGIGAANTIRIRSLEQELADIVTKRAAYNRARYSAAEQGSYFQMRRNPQRGQTQPDTSGKNSCAGVDTQLCVGDGDNSGNGAGNVGDLLHAQQLPAQSAIADCNAPKRENQYGTGPHGAQSQDLGHFINGKQGGQIRGARNIANPVPRLEGEQSASLEVGVNHDGIRTASHSQPGKTGNKSHRQDGCNCVRIDGVEEPHSRYGTACISIRSALQRAGQYLAAIERPDPCKANKSKSVDLSR